jgi:diadenylate cyclase
VQLTPFGFLEFGPKDLVETLIIASILAYLYRLIRGSFAVPAFIGIVFIFAINALVSVFNLSTISFLLRSVLDVGVLAVIILFQPEIRKLLYNIGQNTNLDKIFGRSSTASIIDEIVDAVKILARSKTGAIIVFGQTANLSDLMNNGVRLDARVTSELLISIFQKETPLHDGAVIIKEDRIVAASCLLPISYNQSISSSFGTRHRAALGVTEATNVFVVVVSEETGRISIAERGNLTSGLTVQNLRSKLEEVLGRPQESEPDVTFTNKATA